MNQSIKIGLCFFSLLLLTACWDAEELTDRGFVLGHGLDITETGKIMVTTQVYRPSASNSQSQVSSGSKDGSEPPYSNIKTSANSVFNAIRLIPLYTGRITHSSHLRIILIGEELARKMNLGDILEVFYRDNNVRITSPVMITKGKAGDYFELNPLMEKTISEQIFASEIRSNITSQKAIDTNLLKLALQMRSEVGNSILPYVSIKNTQLDSTPIVDGVALFKKGKLIGTLSPDKVGYLKMLLNEFQNGAIEVPCQNRPNKGESFEVSSLQTVLNPIINKDSLQVKASIKMNLIVAELSCSNNQKQSDEEELVKRIEKRVKMDLEETIATLQAKKFDAINLGNKVYAKDVNLWRKWKKNWDQRFAKTRFAFDVQVRIISSGTATGKHFFSK